MAHLFFPKNTKITRIEKGSIIPIFFSLIKFLKHKRPHIISTHITPSGNLLLLIYLAKKIACLPAPIVVTNHDTLEFPVDEFVTFFLRKLILKRGISHLVTISRGLQKIVERMWGVPYYKIITIYNPIVGAELFKDLYEPEEYKFFPDCIKIVVVARLDMDTKDFVTILQAFSLFRESYPKTKLFIVGEGPDKDKIQQMINELRLQNDVFILGFHNNPYRYIKFADMLLHSSFVEAFGRTIVEAMALGCPVIATDCPVGPREIIRNEENGLLVPMKDPEKMAEAMKKIVEDPALRKKIILNGKAKANEFTISTSIKKREELFRELLQGGNKNAK